MITDEELLAACLSAGRPGSPAYREAWRLYRQAAAEWRERDTAWRQAAADSCQLPDGGTWRSREQAARALRESPVFTAHLAGELVLGIAA